jgi:hypothetical protein
MAGSVSQSACGSGKSSLPWSVIPANVVRKSRPLAIGRSSSMFSRAGITLRTPGKVVSLCAVLSSQSTSTTGMVTYPLPAPPASRTALLSSAVTRISWSNTRYLLIRKCLEPRGRQGSPISSKTPCPVLDRPVPFLTLNCRQGTDPAWLRGCFGHGPATCPSGDCQRHANSIEEGDQPPMDLAPLGKACVSGIDEKNGSLPLEL